MARDSFNREIDYLRISVTDRCNLRCIYCMPEKDPHYFKPEDILTCKEIIRIVKSSMKFGVKKIRLTGGEPLLRQDILHIISSIKNEGIRDLSLTTNGSLVSDISGELKRAGLDRMNISLDTMDPEKYRKITCGGDIEKVYAGIREAETEGFSAVKINMVPIRGINEEEILSFARLTLGKPYHIRFIEFMPSGRKELWDDTRCIKSAEIMDIVSTLGLLEQLEFKGKGPSRNYRIKGAVGMLGFISPVSHSFCYSCNRLRLNAVGKIKPCLFSQTEVDVITPLRNGAGDEEIERLFSLAIAIKPEGNYLKHPSEALINTMSSIGG